jgi:hypothetical protein
MAQRDLAKRARSYSVPAVDRMLDIAEFLVQRSRPFGITELARELGRFDELGVPDPAPICTIAGTSDLDEESGGYRVGDRLLPARACGSRRDSTLRTRARPHLEWLAAQAGETATIQIPDGDRVLVLDAANPPAEFFFQIVVGSRFHYHCNAMGKCILAFLSDAELQASLPRRLPAPTDNTITDRRRLGRRAGRSAQDGRRLRPSRVYDWRLLYRLPGF